MPKKWFLSSKTIAFYHFNEMIETYGLIRKKPIKRNKK